MAENKIGIIEIKDIIGDCNDALGIFLIDIIKQFKSQPETTTFKVFINSRGGDILEAFKIKAYFEGLINNQGYTLMTIGEEIVASSATIVHQAGSKGRRFLMPTCKFMIHCPSGEIKGNTQAINQYSEFITEVNDMMADSYEESFEIPRDIILEMMETETFMTAQDCEALGIAQIYNETPIVARANI